MRLDFVANGNKKIEEKQNTRQMNPFEMKRNAV